MTSRRDGGFTTIQYVATVALSLLLLVLVANVLVDLYARGAIRDALDEGVRAGAPVGRAVSDCEQRAQEVLDGLLRGPVGGDIEVTCERDGDAVRAYAEGALPSWLPMLTPDWHLDLEASMDAES